jgi:hypothetical protein
MAIFSLPTVVKKTPVKLGTMISRPKNSVYYVNINWNLDTNI